MQVLVEISGVQLGNIISDIHRGSERYSVQFQWENKIDLLG